MTTRVPRIFGKYMASASASRKRRQLRLEDLVLSFGLTLSLVALSILFALVLPSISNETVHRSDTEVLQRVQHLATASAAGSAVSAAILVLSLRRVWIRLRTPHPTPRR